MELSQYQIECRRTMDMSFSPEERIELCLFGICGEVGEIVDLYKKERFHKVETPMEKYEKEMGDVLWYIANLCTETDTVFEPYHKSLRYHLLDRASGHIFETPASMLKYLAKIASQFDTIDPQQVLTQIIKIGTTLGCRPIEEIADMNIAKLKARYPNRFNTQDSIARRDTL